MNDSKFTIYLYVIVLVILGVFICIGGIAISALMAPSQVDTLVVHRVVHDTIRLAGETRVKTIVVKLPMAPDNKNGLDTNTFANCADSLHNKDTVFIDVSVKDSVSVEVPVEQRTYEGEYYTAVVQGFRPELVSIDIKVPEEKTVIANKHKWWSVSIGPQVGFGFTPVGWQPYAGIGVSVGVNL